MMEFQDMSNRSQACKEAITRVRCGFYPYFDKKNDANYWDRDSNRSILLITPELVIKASRMLQGIDETYDIRWNYNVPRVLIDLQDETIKPDTWLNAEVANIYTLLHEGGLLRTIEAYDNNGTLCGALLGVQLGDAFLAETMYNLRPNASKACLCNLVMEMKQQGGQLIDVQVQHAEGHPVNRLGETQVSLVEYLKLLRRASKHLDEQFGAIPSDVRMDSQFPIDKNDWNCANPKIVNGKQGQTLYLCGLQMIQDWEKPLMSAMGEAAAREGDKILEIGFGLGISANAIQSRSPSLHVIVEANKHIAELARRKYFAETQTKKVCIIEGFWQEALPELAKLEISTPLFDGIVFDPYPLVSSEIAKQSFEFFSTAAQLLASGGRFTYYSDEVDVIGPRHLAAIKQHFPRALITTQRVDVNPWADCEYWNQPSILHILIENP